MHFNIADVVSKFKREWTTCLAPEAISALCREAGLSWRERLLTPATTIQLMLLQVMHGNTAISHLPHLANLNFWPSSFCRARSRIPLSLFELLLRRLADSLQHEDFSLHSWLGHRVFIADGTSVSMPDSPELESHFGYPPNQRKGAAFPVARLVFMLHQGTGMIAKVLINPYRSHEAAYVTAFHPELKAGDIFLADRAFCSYAHFALLIQRGVHALIRMNQKMLPFFLAQSKEQAPFKHRFYRVPDSRSRIRLIGKTDHIVDWKKPATPSKTCSNKQFHALPDSIIVRELLYRIQKKGFRSTSITVLTTLLDADKYPAQRIADLYGLRWEIETNFGHLKTTMQMDILKTKTPLAIQKEIYSFCIVYNLVRLVMTQAANRQLLPVNRLSFFDALRWLLSAGPSSTLNDILILQHRPGRFEPRSRKRRPKAGFPFMMMTRPELRKMKLSQCVAH